MSVQTPDRIRIRCNDLSGKIHRLTLIDHLGPDRESVSTDFRRHSVASCFINEFVLMGRKAGSHFQEGLKNRHKRSLFPDASLQDIQCYDRIVRQKTVNMMRDACAWGYKNCLCLSDHLCKRIDLILRNMRDFFCFFDGISQNHLLIFLEAKNILVDKALIDPVIFDQDRCDRVRQIRIGPGLRPDEQVRTLNRCRRKPGVNDDCLAAFFLILYQAPSPRKGAYHAIIPPADVQIRHAF